MGGLFSSKKKLLKQKPDVTLSGGRIRHGTTSATARSASAKKKRTRAATDKRRSNVRGKAFSLENNALGGRSR